MEIKNEHKSIQSIDIQTQICIAINWIASTDTTISIWWISCSSSSKKFFFFSLDIRKICIYIFALSRMRYVYGLQSTYRKLQIALHRCVVLCHCWSIHLKLFNSINCTLFFQFVLIFRWILIQRHIIYFLPPTMYNVDA